MEEHIWFLTWDTVNNNERSIGEAKSGGDFRGEIDVAGGIDLVDEETLDVHLSGLFDKLQVLVVHLEVHGDGAREEEVNYVRIQHSN